MRLIPTIFDTLLMIGGVFFLGYYIATTREHRRAMDRLDALKKELLEIDDKRIEALKFIKQREDSAWASRLKN